MDRKAIDYIMNYCEEQGADIQITYRDNEYIADFRYQIHASVIGEEMNKIGMEVQVNPPGFYARVV